MVNQIRLNPPPPITATDAGKTTASINMRNMPLVLLCILPPSVCYGGYRYPKLSTASPNLSWLLIFLTIFLFLLP